MKNQEVRNAEEELLPILQSARIARNDLSGRHPELESIEAEQASMSAPLLEEDLDRVTLGPFITEEGESALQYWVWQKQESNYWIWSEERRSPDLAETQRETRRMGLVSPMTHGVENYIPDLLWRNGADVIKVDGSTARFWILCESEALAERVKSVYAPSRSSPGIYFRAMQLMRIGDRILAKFNRWEEIDEKMLLVFSRRALSMELLLNGKAVTGIDL